MIINNLSAISGFKAVLFGKNDSYDDKYEKDIAIDIADKKISVGSKEQHKLFILNREKANDIFSNAETNTPNLVNYLLRLALKNSSNRVVNDSSSTFSLIKGKTTAQAIITAFENAMAQLPKKATELMVSFPAPSVKKQGQGVKDPFDDLSEDIQKPRICYKTKPARKLIDNPMIPVVKELAEQVTLEGYNLNFYRQNDQHQNKLEKVVFNNLPDVIQTQEAVKEGKAIGKGTNQARFLVDAHPGIKNPEWIAKQAYKLQEMYRGTITTGAYNSDWLRAQKMNLLLAVAAGNKDLGLDMPRLLEMVYTPDGGKYDKTVLLVGKGITFDTGGVNLKTGADEKTRTPYIDHMHGDMAGAAAVIGAMKTIAEMKIPNVRVVALTPLTPNRMDADATLPHTIITSRQGKTVAIDNTDAEGRLVLADTLNYGGETYQPDLIIDIATLTGGKARALGGFNAVAIMGNSYKLSQKIENIEKELGRKTAALNLTPTHQKWVTKGGKGQADVYNSVTLPEGKRHGLFGPGVEFDASNTSHVIQHSAQGGAFLKNFLHNPKTPWVHLDIAGAEFAPLENRNGTKYATGFGVKELYTIVKKVSDGSLELDKPD